jgi:glycosyltransferase involved in cell wall biosynthesis
VKWSVITPSLRGGDWLKLCIASVADQGVEIEHIVQDGGSDDGTLAWLLQDSRVRTFVEKDDGMYDAINRGLRRAHGELLAWLNCDEQYLPGALKSVAAWFEAHPDIDVLFGDVIVVNPKGEYLYHRKMQVPLLYHTWTCHLSTLSCATFFRRRLIFDRGFWFDPTFRAGGDGEWVVRLLHAGVKMRTLGEFTSAFTQTGTNLGISSMAAEEAQRLRLTAPVWARLARPGFIFHHRFRRLFGGMYRKHGLAYQIYTFGNPILREQFVVDTPVVRALKL